MSKKIADNLKSMDSIFCIHEPEVSSIDATKSTDALMAYLSQNSCGRWVINYYSHLSASDKRVFTRRMNNVLPYVKNNDAFIERIKYSMKENLCKTIDFDCYIDDLMGVSGCEYVLTDEGFEAIHRKYEKEIDQFLKDLNEDYLAELEEDNQLLDLGTESKSTLDDLEAFDALINT